MGSTVNKILFVKLATDMLPQFSPYPCDLKFGITHSRCQKPRTAKKQFYTPFVRQYGILNNEWGVL